MSNLVLTAQGAVEADGRPEYFLEDETFNDVLCSVDSAIELYRALGGKNVCVGRVGSENSDGVFEERKYDGHTVFAEAVDKRGLGFYERCS